MLTLVAGCRLRILYGEVRVATLGCNEEGSSILRQAAFVRMFLCLFRFCIFALQVGERHVRLLVAEPDSDGLTAQVILWLGGWTRSHKKVKTVSLRGQKIGWRPPPSNVVLIGHSRTIVYL